jgi:hypothetical protein
MHPHASYGFDVCKVGSLHYRPRLHQRVRRVCSTPESNYAFEAEQCSAADTRRAPSLPMMRRPNTEEKTSELGNVAGRLVGQVSRKHRKKVTQDWESTLCLLCAPRPARIDPGNAGNRVSDSTGAVKDWELRGYAGWEAHLEAGEAQRDSSFRYQ